jgi:hypothetical protein
MSLDISFIIKKMPQKAYISFDDFMFEKSEVLAL